MAKIFWNELFDWWIFCDRCYQISKNQQWGICAPALISVEDKQRQQAAAAATLRRAIASPFWRCEKCRCIMIYGCKLRRIAIRNQRGSGRRLITNKKREAIATPVRV